MTHSNRRHNLCSRTPHLQKVGSTDAKRLRAGSPNGNIQVIQPAATCPSCNGNTASARCARGVCKKCCLEKNADEEKAFNEEASTENKENGAVFQPVCEMHLDKVKKEQEKREQLKAHRQAKKARAQEIQQNEQSRKAAKKEAAMLRKGKKGGEHAGLIEVQPSVEA